MPCVLVKVSTAMKGQHDRGHFYKGKHLIGIGLQVQMFSHASRHDSTQTDTVVEKLLRSN